MAVIARDDSPAWSGKQHVVRWLRSGTLLCKNSLSEELVDRRSISCTAESRVAGHVLVLDHPNGQGRVTAPTDEACFPIPQTLANNIRDNCSGLTRSTIKLMYGRVPHRYNQATDSALISKASLSACSRSLLRWKLLIRRPGSKGNHSITAVYLARIRRIHQ